MIKNRAYLVENLLRECQLDAFIFLNLPNIRYLSGFIGTDGAFVAAGARDCFLTDSRYTTQARQQVTADDVREYKDKLDGITAFLEESGAKRVGFEAETVSYATVQKLKEKGPRDAEWIPVEKEILSLRSIKDSSEIGVLCEAARISAEAFEEVFPMIRPGITEREVALSLEFAMKHRGGEEKSFDFIVASGTRGAMPHGVASDKAICKGELVTIDFGARYQGYHSDETVTFGVGEVSPRLREIYDIVLEAHDRAMAAVKPGVLLKDIDDAARQYIAQHGYGEYFGHGLGHGAGLEIHEFPRVSPKSEGFAKEGMVFTIEPGIYIPELGGVRIEDMVMVTADGCRRITRLPKNYRAVQV